jgi:hypothetical protein
MTKKLLVLFLGNPIRSDEMIGLVSGKMRRLG